MAGHAKSTQFVIERLAAKSVGTGIAFVIIVDLVATQTRQTFAQILIINNQAIGLDTDLVFETHSWVALSAIV